MIIGNDEEFSLLATHADDVGEMGLNSAGEMAENGHIILYKQAERVSAEQVAALNSLVFFWLSCVIWLGYVFLGTLLARLQDDLSLEEAIREGSAAAAFVVSRIGCASAMPDGQNSPVS